MVDFLHSRKTTLYVYIRMYTTYTRQDTFCSCGCLTMEHLQSDILFVHCNHYEETPSNLLGHTAFSPLTDIAERELLYTVIGYVVPSTCTSCMRTSTLNWRCP